MLIDIEMIVSQDTCQAFLPHKSTKDLVDESCAKSEPCLFVPNAMFMPSYFFTKYLPPCSLIIDEVHIEAKSVLSRKSS